MGTYISGDDGVAVEAFKLTKENAAALAHVCRGRLVEEIDPNDPSITFVGINVPGETGPFRVSEGDYLVKSHWGMWNRGNAQAFEARFSEAGAH